MQQPSSERKIAMRTSNPLNLKAAQDLHQTAGEIASNPMQGNARKCAIRENDLNNKHKSAIEMLALGKSFTATAKALDINPGTLYRWRQEESFNTALQDRRDQIWDTAGDRLKDLVHASLEVMADMMTHPYDGARIRAAATILKLLHPATVCRD
jgi:hypothetical protein